MRNPTTPMMLKIMVRTKKEIIPKAKPIKSTKNVAMRKITTPMKCFRCVKIGEGNNMKMIGKRNAVKMFRAEAVRLNAPEKSSDKPPKPLSTMDWKVKINEFPRKRSPRATSVIRF